MAPRAYVGNKLVVAVIDIGTTHSGYGLSFKHEYENDPTKVHMNQVWRACSLVTLRTPTCILFNKNMEFHSFGFEAEEHYAELRITEEDKDYYFFKRFKIHHNADIDDVQGKKCPAKKIFGEAIRYLKHHLLDYMERRGIGVESEDIHWVLTVPATWQDSGKQLMREAAYVAGIQDDQLSLALEPVAAIVYCQLLSEDKLMGSKAAQSALRTTGEKIMVIDLGGDTSDISVFERQGDGALVELIVPGGGPWGGNMIDHEFFQLIRNIVGERVFEKFVHEYDADILDLRRDLETKKRTITPQSEKKITIKVPVSLNEMYHDESGKSVKDAVQKSQYNGRLTWPGDKLRIDAGLFKGLYKECSAKIVQQMQEILKDPQVNGTNTFVMVGGFAESAIIQDAVRKAFPKGNIIVPVEAGLAVLKGAVIFGHQPVEITSRVERHADGSGISHSLGSDSYAASCVAGSDFSHSLGSDSYSSSIRVSTSAAGQDISPDVSRMSVRENDSPQNTASSNRKELTLDVYDSPRHGLQFVKDDDCQLFGHVVVKLPQKGETRKVDVKMLQVTETEITF